MISLENLGKALAKKQLSKGWLFMIVLTVLLILVLPGLFLLVDNIEPSLEKILPQDIEEIKIMNDMRAQYGADMMYIVVEVAGPADDVRDPDVLNFLDTLSQKLRGNDYILEVNSIADFVKDVNNGIIPESNQEIRTLLRLNPRSVGFMNPDYSMTFIEIRSDTGATASVVKKVVRDMERDIETVEEYNPGLDLQITGFNSIDKATFEVIMKDFAYITLFTFTFMLIFLFIYFKGSVAKVLGSVIVIMISVLMTLGLTGYLGLTITVVTMVAAAMIMALAISYGINLTFDYYLLRKNHKKDDALILLNAQLIRALVGSSLTTSAGFLALLFGVIPAMKNLGIVLAMGITITLFVSIFFLPLIIYKLDGGMKNEKN